jgi:hypothetical protein
MGIIPFVTGVSSRRGIQVAIDLLLIALGIALLVVGSGVRGLKPWSRIAAGILSGAGLLAFPLGTLLNAYILSLTSGKKAEMVISERYKAIIAETPHIKHQTSMSAWVILNLTVFVIEIIFVQIIREWGSP